MAKSYEQWLSEIKSKTLKDAQDKINMLNSVIDDEISKNNKIYDQKIADVASEYQQLYDLNEVQKIINQRELEEKMANIGLTDSGLNKTQQTALSLSYSKKMGELTNSEQKAITNLKNELAGYLVDANTRKTENQNKIMQEYEQQAAKQASDLYKAGLEAENEYIKNEVEKQKDTSNSVKKEDAIKQLKSDFSAIKKGLNSTYTDEEKDKILNSLLSAESAYNLSAFECIVLLANAGLTYDDYVTWKGKKSKLESNKISENKSGFINGVNYTPKYLNEKYMKLGRILK